MGMLTLTIVHMVVMARERRELFGKCDEGFDLGVKAEDRNCKCIRLFVARVAVAVALYIVNLAVIGHLILAIKNLYTRIAEEQATESDSAVEDESKPPFVSQSGYVLDKHYDSYL